VQEQCRGSESIVVTQGAAFPLHSKHLTYLAMFRKARHASMTASQQQAAFPTRIGTLLARPCGETRTAADWLAALLPSSED
jgi:hypothetical protein